MSATPWEDAIKTRKVLTVFPTLKVTGPWLTTFNDAIIEFNRLSRSHNLGVTLSSSTTKPDPVGEGGAEVQFDLGKGTLTYQTFGQSVTVMDKSDPNNPKPLDFSPTELHGYTAMVLRQFGGPVRCRRAFVFMPETPMLTAPKRIGPGPDDFRDMKRPVGGGIRLFIAVHEFIHACGLPNADHTYEGIAADIFATGLTYVASFDHPDQDKLLLHNAQPQPNVLTPPIILKKKIADMIRDNWK